MIHKITMEIEVHDDDAMEVVTASVKDLATALSEGAGEYLTSIHVGIDGQSWLGQRWKEQE